MEDAIALGSLIVGVLGVLAAISRRVRSFVTVNAPKFENPYGAPSQRGDAPYGMRFLRVTIRPRWIKLEGVECEMSVTHADGSPIDTPGKLHWERQPRSNVSHPRKLHTDCTTVEAYLQHMYDCHFAHNAPVDISADAVDKVDLFLRLEGHDFYVPASARENRVPPGRYTVTLRIDAANLNKRIERRFEIELPEDFEALLPERWGMTPTDVAAAAAAP